MKYCLFLVFCVQFLPTYAQNPFIRVKKQILYDEVSTDTLENIEGVTALTIFQDDFDNTIWVSPEKQCVKMTTTSDKTYAGASSLRLTWDKVTGGCSWLGLGFGWNNWQSKDLGSIVDNAAIQMQVRSANGTFSNLPVAFALEDYAGTQAYYGFNKTLVKGDFTDTEWRTVTIPLSNFPFEEQDFDVFKVKQFMIQLEGDGDIFLDDIKIVKLPRP